MKINDVKLIQKQESITDTGIASGSSLLYGDKDGVLFEHHYGVSDPERGTPVDSGTVFHMYSMTKVMTVTAALMLYDRGLLGLDDEVSRYLPGYADLTVCENGVIRKAESRMTVRHLFTMTSGLTYLAEDNPGGYSDIERGFGSGGWDTVRFAEELSSVPLAFEPGAQFRYGLSHDVLGAIIEIISGKTLSEYMKEYIFTTLGMTDTYFYQDLPEKYLPRLAKNTEWNGEKYVNIPLPCRPVPALGVPGGGRLYSGGSGIVCTARDYAKFLSAMLGGGLLNRRTAAMMTSPQLTPEQRKSFNKPEFDPSTFGDEHTFGLGVRVQDRPARGGSVGEWGWSGALGTWFFVDVSDGLWFLYLHQHTPAGHGRYIIPLRNVFYGEVD